MSADANSAYGKPWFGKSSNPADDQPTTSESAAQNKQLTPLSQPTTLSSPLGMTAASFAASSGVAGSPANDYTTTAASAGNLVQPMGTNPQRTRIAGDGLPSAPQGSAAATAIADSTWNDSTSTQAIAGLAAGIKTRMQQTLSDQITPLRLASHLSVLLVAAAVLLFSRIQIPQWDFQLVAMPDATAQSPRFGSVAAQMTALLNQTPSTTSSIAADSLQVQIVPFTIIPERTRKEIQVYSVQGGDTVLAIAARFKVQPETLLWANPALENNPDMLRISDQLRILPIDGVLHTVKAGDTLSALASTYKVDASEIVAYEANNLTDVNAPLIIGTDVVVPGGTKPFVTREVVGMGVTSVPVPAGAAGGSGNFGWPTSGSISQNYWAGHQALDIASREGAPVKAADGGFVTVAGGGWNGGYGNHVIIDHGNGFVTLYAHLNTIFVRAGESVSAGQQIGSVGNTGNSTGPHLHFEIRYQGYPRNPYNYLP